MCPKYYKFNMFKMNITIHLIEWPQLTKTTTTTKLLAIPSVDRMQSNKNSYTLMIQNGTVTLQFGSFL